MAEFLDGVGQGGRLATVADVTVAGGAVTTLTTGAIAPQNNKLYNFSCIIKLAGASTTVRLYVNGDTTNANYARDYLGAHGVFSGNDLNPPIMASDTLDRIYLQGTIICDGTNVIIRAHGHAPERSNTARMTESRCKYAASSIAELQLTSGAASGLANGTNLIITEAY